MINKVNQTVKAIIYSKGKILLQLRDEKPNIFYPGCWGLFGGNVDKNEEPVDALKRELEEEIRFQPKTLKLLFSWNHYKYNSILHFFLVPLSIDYEDLCLNEGQSMKLFSLEEINKLKITPSLKKNLHKMDQQLLYN